MKLRANCPQLFFYWSALLQNLCAKLKLYEGIPSLKYFASFCLCFTLGHLQQTPKPIFYVVVISIDDTIHTFPFKETPDLICVAEVAKATEYVFMLFQFLALWYYGRKVISRLHIFNHQE